jgi:hypothetical protein
MLPSLENRKIREIFGYYSGMILEENGGKCGALLPKPRGLGCEFFDVIQC